MLLKDLEVYNKLCDLAIECHGISLKFPKFEMFELGSQLRRSSNSAPANIAEGFGNKHTNVYTETISRALGEIRETVHHLEMAKRMSYITEQEFLGLEHRFQECSKMLYGLDKLTNQKLEKIISFNFQLLTYN